MSSGSTDKLTRKVVPQEATVSSSSSSAAAASKAQSEVAFVDVVSSTNSGKDSSLSTLNDKISPSFVEVVSTDKKEINNNNVRRILKDANKPTRSPSHTSNSMKASNSKSESEDKASDESDGDGNKKNEDKEENKKIKEEAAGDVVGILYL